MEDVVKAVTTVQHIIGEIVTASNEQSAGIEQVNHAIVQMDAVTQQNAALVEQATAAAQSMADQAQSLRDAVARFIVADDGAGASPAARRPARPTRAVPALGMRR
jgi:methyl-accepting chemotaxis protein